MDASPLKNEQDDGRGLGTDDDGEPGWRTRFALVILTCFCLFCFGIAVPALGKPYLMNTVMCPGWAPPPQSNGTDCAQEHSTESGDKYACPAGAQIFGIAQAIDSVGGVLFCKFWGAASDVYGRRPFLVINSIMYAASALCLYFAEGPVLLLMSSVLTGLFSGGVLLFNSYVIDVVPPRQRGALLGIFAGVGIGLAFGIGIPTGTIIYAVHGRTVFLVAAIGCAVSASLAALCLSAPPSVEYAERIDWRYTNPLATICTFFKSENHPAMRAALPTLILVNFAGTIFTFILLSYAPWRWHWSAMQTGLVFGIMGISVACTSPACFRALKTESAVIRAGAASFTVGFVAAGLAGCLDLGFQVVAVSCMALAQPVFPSLTAFFSRFASSESQGDMQANLSVFQNAVLAIGVVVNTQIFIASEKGMIAPGAVWFVGAAAAALGCANFQFFVLRVSHDELEQKENLVEVQS